MLVRNPSHGSTPNSPEDREKYGTCFPLLQPSWTYFCTTTVSQSERDPFERERKSKQIFQLCYAATSFLSSFGTPRQPITFSGSLPPDRYCLADTAASTER
eukprot:763627-Hanusia_phi.AAC.12